MVVPGLADAVVAGPAAIGIGLASVMARTHRQGCACAVRTITWIKVKADDRQSFAAKSRNIWRSDLYFLTCVSAEKAHPAAQRQ
jgi:hypothetical protein